MVSAAGIVRHGNPPQLVPLRKVWPMFQQLSSVALVAVAALGCLTAANGFLNNLKEELSSK
jgi:hypothetical protein